VQNPLGYSGIKYKSNGIYGLIIKTTSSNFDKYY